MKTICSKCGDNICSEWEHFCTCPEDCDCVSNSQCDGPGETCEDGKCISIVRAP